MPKDTRYLPVISIIGKQNVGKTTLIGLIIPYLKKKGYRVGTIKYNIPHFEIDYEGKDTYRHYEAGADIVSISSPEKLAIIKRLNQRPLSIQDIVNHAYSDVDIVLVEGYKKYRYPYVEIYNNCLPIGSRDRLYKNHIRIASTLQTRSPIPTFNKIDLNNVIKFIELKIKQI
ncbi:MAG: molybdopterin-guanine dinucleotide biosynthesis protein B [Candidatus Jettenia sp. CY-1]|nr:MAG: molybdopterin-guanine dinucleotide biosynthesis protein B [Candidatus Jettenia sp. CY-1]